MSFTFCSQNRETEGGYISGDHRNNSVSSVGSRTGFVVEDAIRRYGFDIRFSYMRTDEMPTEIIEKANPVGITH